MTDGFPESDELECSSERLETLFLVLANSYCRQVIRYFQRGGGDAASLDDIVDATWPWEGGPDERSQVALTFHHVTLPKLADADLLEYDVRSQVVRYHGHPLLTQVMQLLTQPGDVADD